MLIELSDMQILQITYCINALEAILDGHKIHVDINQDEVLTVKSHLNILREALKPASIEAGF